MKWGFTDHAEQRLRERFPGLVHTLADVAAEAVPVRCKSANGDQLWVSVAGNERVYLVVKHEAGTRVVTTVLTGAQVDHERLDTLENYLKAEVTEAAGRSKAWVESEVLRLEAAHQKSVQVTAALASTLSRMRRLLMQL